MHCLSTEYSEDIDGYVPGSRPMADGTPVGVVNSIGNAGGSNSRMRSGCKRPPTNGRRTHGWEREIGGPAATGPPDAKRSRPAIAGGSAHPLA